MHFIPVDFVVLTHAAPAPEQPRAGAIDDRCSTTSSSAAASAGSVLANRLSARSSNRVLLCEAGIDTPVGSVPASILDGYAGSAFLNPDFLWNELQVTTEVIPHNDASRRPRLRKYEQARVLGGGSSINGQLANRGAPHDYDDWEARGARGWTWESVLPYFRKIERDLDFDGPYHGKDGPIPVRRLPREMWSPHSKVLGDGLTQLGFDYVPDQNGEFKVGWYPLVITNVDDQRVSAAMAYLDPATRRRPNLALMTQTHVQQLLFEGRRCVGVVADVDGARREFRAAKSSCHAARSIVRRTCFAPASAPPRSCAISEFPCWRISRASAAG